ncbi:hypothetical protein SEA_PAULODIABOLI_223 [Microbacterium phage PauloDiaboli]|nr:hypothetical protein SEA_PAULODIABOLI_223 [Microbacterium phage PauloDiaboli]QWY84030.1 hypothetical protein SEA_A3WALLY_223 [Microbacterium phage A3Wally]
MGIFKLRDRAKRDEWKNAHKAALKRAVEAHAFWRDIQSAYDQYTHTMEQWGARPVTMAVFRENFHKVLK